MASFCPTRRAIYAISKPPTENLSRTRPTDRYKRYVAKLLGEDEGWLHDLSIDMFPEDGCLWVYGVGEDGVPAFTQDGIDNLRQIIADQRATGKAPPLVAQK